GDGVGEGHSDDVVLLGDVREPHEGRVVVEVVPVAGEGGVTVADWRIGGFVRGRVGRVGRVRGAVAGAEELPHAPFAGGAGLFTGGPPLGAVLLLVVADQVAADVDLAGLPGGAFAGGLGGGGGGEGDRDGRGGCGHQGGGGDQRRFSGAVQGVLHDS